MASQENRRQSILFPLISIGMTVLFLELASVGLHYALHGGIERPTPPEQTVKESGTATSEEEPGSELGFLHNGTREVLHPYLGFVGEPGHGFADTDLEAYGFAYGGRFPWPSGEGPVRIGLVGGSLAKGFGIAAGRDTLVAKLSAELFEGREVELFNLALAGYKQPQQLLVVQYILALGGHLDAVVNIDGFNEVVLGSAENAPKGVSNFYPRNWFYRVGALDPELLRQRGELEALRIQRTQLAKRFGWVRFSATASLIWSRWDQKLASKTAMASVQLAEREVTDPGFQAQGPPWVAGSQEELLDRDVSSWARCSALLQRLCESNSIRYFHFLQPNQYVDGSKPMGDEERARAIAEGTTYARWAAPAYPKLIAMGQRMAEVGIPFTDLTPIFRDVEEPLYIDDCCHVGQEGNRIIAEHIGQVIIEGWDAEPRSPLGISGPDPSSLFDELSAGLPPLGPPPPDRRQPPIIVP